MDKLCSICGSTGSGIEFKKGYVCEECLKYIKAGDTVPADEHSSSSNESVNGSEIETSTSPGIRHIISVDQS